MSLHTVEISNGFIWHIDRALSGATNPGRSGPGGDEERDNIYINCTSSMIYKKIAFYGIAHLIRRVLLIRMKNMAQKKR